ncbi:MAG: hypothetical protein NTV22_02350, partial [bacterium]|nr:hypothetical protein [bacterium]
MVGQQHAGTRALRPQPHFSRAQRIPVPLPATPGAATQAWLALLGHPRWHTNDILTGLRLVFDAAPGAELTLAYACTAVDTRHNNNNPIFIEACHAYAAWSGDTNFLAGAMPRLRLALRYALDEFAVRTNACIVTPWLGHDGTSGVTFDAHGNKIIRNGDGIGNNYFDLLPFGGRDVYATIYLYRALKKMAALEEAVAQHAEWHIAAPPAALAPRALRQLAHLLAVNNTQFWNEATGRFGTRDGNGVLHDYGFTFLACEAVSSGYASPRQAEQIMQWLDGTRIVAGDTSTGADMYRWEFAPRATTRRNTDYYTYSWPHPETIPFGGQVQDGGAVLCFSYHDLMTRLRTRGPDNAWQRLRAITDWLGRVQDEGGYREYYYGGTVATRGTLQGGGPAGGLGLDCEFFESVLMPQVLLYGFMGVRPRLDGLVVRPRLPHAWPSLTIT